jgi:hypothetical protein
MTTPQHQTALQALSDIARECQHCDGAQPDVTQAVLRRVGALAEAELQAAAGVTPARQELPTPAQASPGWQMVAGSAAALSDLMSDTVDPSEPQPHAARAQADADSAPAPLVTDAEWRVQTLQLQRQALEQVQQAEQAAAVWRAASAAAAEQRHLATQHAAQRRHEAQIEAMASAGPASPRILALQLLSALPPEWPLPRRHAAMHAALELVLRYPERAGDPLPQPPKGSAEAPTPEPSPAPAPAPAPTPAPNPAPGAADWPTVEDFSRRRGLNYFYASRSDAQVGHIATMAEMGATLMRCWLDVTWDDAAGQYVTTGTERMRDAAALAQSRAMLTVVCLLIPNADQPWGSPQRMAAIVQLWCGLERAFADLPSVVCDICNEPYPSATLTGYDGDSAGLYTAVGRHARDAAIACVGAIQALNPRRLCVVKLGYGADPNAFVDLEPIPLPNVVHSAHMWLPHSYTHHGITEATQGLPLPAPVAYVDHVRDALVRNLRRLADWSSKHGGLPVYVAETGAHAYLPGAHEYVRESLAFCDQMGWPASYHEIYGDPVWRPTEAMRQTLLAWLGAGKGQQVRP